MGGSSELHQSVKFTTNYSQKSFYKTATACRRVIT